VFADAQGHRVGVASTGPPRRRGPAPDRAGPRARQPVAARRAAPPPPSTSGP
jgi:hypothetical protein